MNYPKINKIIFFHRKKINTYFSAPIIDLTLNSKIKKILIIKWGALGDLIISSAIMDDISNAFPNAEIHLNTSEEFSFLFSNDKRFSSVWFYKIRKSSSRLLNNFEWFRTVRKNSYDLIIDLQTNDHSRLLLSLIKIFHLGSHIYLLGNHPVYPYNIKHNNKFTFIHSLDIQQQTISLIGIKPSTNLPVITENIEDKNNVIALLSKVGLLKKKYVIFIPGSNINGKLKRWGADNFIILSHLINNRSKEKIVLIGGPDDKDECHRIANNNHDIVNLCSLTKLSYLPELFKRASLIVSNDTGTAHLTGLSDVPTLLINGPTDPLRVMPIGKNVRAIQADIECKNCYKKTCSHHSCMVNLTPESILKIIGEFYNE
jgi:heptosyltransferase II